MEGFDKVLINNLFAYEPFQKAFGVQLADGTYQLTAAWQSALSNGALIGEILGLLVNGIAAEKFGYRKTMITALGLVIAFIFVVFFAQNTITLLVGQILCGIPWGEFSQDRLTHHHLTLTNPPQAYSRPSPPPTPPKSAPSPSART